jgi:hypothetical protein
MLSEKASPSRFRKRERNDHQQRAQMKKRQLQKCLGENHQEKDLKQLTEQPCCWRISSDAGQCRFSYEGCGPLCCFILFAETGCRKSIAFGRFR